jgi:hypothetical protein
MAKVVAQSNGSDPRLLILGSMISSIHGKTVKVEARIIEARMKPGGFTGPVSGGADLEG